MDWEGRVNSRRFLTTFFRETALCRSLRLTTPPDTLIAENRTPGTELKSPPIAGGPRSEVHFIFIIITGR